MRRTRPRATPGEGSFWTRCAITIAPTTGNVSRSCGDGNGQNSPGVNRILDAATDRGKTVISGVGIDPAGERFAFTGVKR